MEEIHSPFWIACYGIYWSVAGKWICKRQQNNCLIDYVEARIEMKNGGHLCNAGSPST